MAQRGIREYDAKRMLANFLPQYLKGDFEYEGKVALVTPDQDLDSLVKDNPWLKKDKLVVKPDQLFGKRGKHGLLLVNVDFSEAKKWIAERMNQDTTVGKVTDKLTHFLVEPFTPHEAEYYVSIVSNRFGDTVRFSTEGGIDIEENWDKVISIDIPMSNGDNIDFASFLPDNLALDSKKLGDFLKALHKFYAECDFAFLEINPFAVANGQIVPLDCVAKLDDTAAFKQEKNWGSLEFPAPFGRKLSPEEQYISDLDEKTGASLKLTVLNPEGNVWTMVAGGGASVIYADTIVDLGFGDDLANYGEYSGNPNEEFTYLYAKTVLDLMTRKKDSKGRNKYLLIGGGIANFTDVAKTFAGIIRALTEFKDKLIANNVKIYVRRGGPNYEEGLRLIKELGNKLGLPIEVGGPEMHMTKIVSMALTEQGGK